MSSITLVYRGLCPNCKGPISHTRLENGLPCRKCLPTPLNTSNPIDIERGLAKHGSLLGYIWISSLERDFTRFKGYFKEKLGHDLWSAQSSWAKRLLLMDNLAIIAPTGVGKSTLLMVYTAYRVEHNGWKVLYIAPTENIVRQVALRLTSLVKGRVVYYYSSMNRKSKEEMLNVINSGQFDVLVITTGFLQKRFNMLEKLSPFNLVIVDDVDSILRNSRNIDRVLLLMGIDSETIETAYKLVNTKLKLYNAITTGNNGKAEELQKKIADLDKQLREKQYPLSSQLVIASATGRPRGIKHLIFKELLGFEVGGTTDYMRNVIDSYIITDNLVQTIASLVERLGKGGIIFVSQSYGKPMAKLVVEKLNSMGIKAVQALTSSRRAIDKLSQGKADVIVGIASRYGVIVRGIDLPEVIRYAIFVGAPARKMNAHDALFNVKRLIRVLIHLSEAGDKLSKEYLYKLKKLIDKISDPTLITLAAKGRIDADGLLNEAGKLVVAASDYAIKRILSSLESGSRNGILRIGSMVFSLEDGLYVYIPDAPTYLQASGRTSRLLEGRMTLGLSIIVEKHYDFVKALEERLSWYTASRLVELDKLDLDRIISDLYNTRRGHGKKVSVETILLLVESPTKAKTVAWFWGRPSKRRIGHLTIYETSAIDMDAGKVYILHIASSKGHMLDLALDEEGSEHGVIVSNGAYTPVYDTIKKCINCGYVFSSSAPCPRCGSLNIVDAKSRINVLRKLAVEVDKVVIATDPDREGEKIAWDIYLALKPYNRNIVRARIHEITRGAVLESLRSPTTIDKRQVYAQIVRRIEDRWIGFSLSKILWNTFGKKWLGAGRVQTPVLGWVIERYEVWKRNRGYIVLISLEGGGRITIFVEDKDEANNLLEIKNVTVNNVKYSIGIKNPPPPYTTDALIYEASSKLGYPASLTMKLAQDLFESGLITYHRTDSIRVSPTGLGIAKAYLSSKGMLDYYNPRMWSDKGAHEAIRPTKPLDSSEIEEKILDGSIKVPIKLYRAHYRLYDLIFKRFMASQMKEAHVKEAKISFILKDNITIDLEVIVDIVKEGFNAIYNLKLDKWAANLKPGEQLKVEEIKAYRGSRIKLFKSGDLVRLMKEKRIGRPSTYVKAIESNKRHGYIIESKKARYLIPTKLGFNVYNLLITNYKDLITEETSKRMEELLDKIEKGLIDPSMSLSLVYDRINRITSMGYIRHVATRSEAIEP